jgi:hypothetical protein
VARADPRGPGPDRGRGVTVRARLAAHERPGWALKGPPITVSCPCGRRRELAHGARWTCDCGLRWDTGRIDAAQYRRLRSVQRRFRLLPVGLGLATGLLAVLFVVTHQTFSLVLLLPTVLLVWGTVLRPAHRRRYAAALGELPRWRLRPEPREEP